MQLHGRRRLPTKRHKDTLVIITADHGHSMTLNGTYNTKGAAGKSGEELRELVGTYPNGIHYNCNLPHDEYVEVHTFDDVPINTMDPGSELFTGYMDNTQVFRYMVTALGLKAN